MITLVKLSCQSCGSPLDVPESATFVTCNHCSTRLAIRRTATATFTEQLENLEAGQDELRERLLRMELESRLARLERDWEREEKEYCDSQNNPPTLAGVLIGIVPVGFGTIFSLLMSNLAFGLLGVLVGGGIAIWNHDKLKRYDAAFGRYRQSRLILINEMEESRQSSVSQSRAAG